MGEKENYTKEIITSILGVLILLVLIFGTSYAVSVKESDVKINTLTMGYLSFNFTEGNSNTILVIIMNLVYLMIMIKVLIMKYY